MALSILNKVNCYWLIGVLALLTFLSGEELVVYTCGGISKPRKISLLVTWGFPFPCLAFSCYTVRSIYLLLGHLTDQRTLDNFRLTLTSKSNEN